MGNGGDTGGWEGKRGRKEVRKTRRRRFNTVRGVDVALESKGRCFSTKTKIGSTNWPPGNNRLRIAAQFNKKHRIFVSPNLHVLLLLLLLHVVSLQVLLLLQLLPKWPKRARKGIFGGATAGGQQRPPIPHAPLSRRYDIHRSRPRSNEMLLL